MQWHIQLFDQLGSQSLYDLLKLRSKVFVVEQNCVFLDMDDKDQKCLHVMGYQDNLLVACSRLVPPGISYAEMSIGRVATDPSYRNTGAGIELMAVSVKQIREAFGLGPIRIGAQLYLKNFYEKWSFRQISDIYLEDGIPHIEMICEA